MACGHILKIEIRIKRDKMKRIITLIIVAVTFVASAVAANRQEASFPGGEKACRNLLQRI